MSHSHANVNYFACAGVNPHRSMTTFYICSKNSFNDKKEAQHWIDELPFVDNDIYDKCIFEKNKWMPITLSANYELWNKTINRIQYQ